MTTTSATVPPPLTPSPDDERVAPARVDDDATPAQKAFHPRSGVVVVARGGVLALIQIWEGNAPAESACPTGLVLVPPHVATLEILPDTGKGLVRASGYRTDDKTWGSFSGRLRTRQVRALKTALPANLTHGAVVSARVEVRDDSGATFDGDVRLVVCAPDA